jgi:hypothetical protein
MLLADKPVLLSLRPPPYSGDRALARGSLNDEGPLPGPFDN